MALWGVYMPFRKSFPFLFILKNMTKLVFLYHKIAYRIL